jgi:hypothetical protein
MPGFFFEEDELTGGLQKHTEKLSSRMLPRQNVTILTDAKVILSEQKEYIREYWVEKS